MLKVFITESILLHITSLLKISVYMVQFWRVTYVQKCMFLLGFPICWNLIVLNSL